MTLEFTKPPEDPYPNILVYGAGKVGKTTLACSGPPGVLLLNADLPNASRHAHMSYPDGRIMEIKVPPWQKGNAKRMLSIMNEISAQVIQPQKLVGTVVIDPVDELFGHVLEDLSGRAMNPDYRIYGPVYKHIERFVRFLCQCPVVLVLVCHELAEKDDDQVVRIPHTGTKSGSSDFGAKLEQLVDIIAYAGTVETEKGETVYATQLTHAKGRHGGDRFDCLGSNRTDEISDWIKTIKAHEAELRKTNKATSKKDARPVAAASSDRSLTDNGDSGTPTERAASGKRTSTGADGPPKEGVAK